MTASASAAKPADVRPGGRRSNRPSGPLFATINVTGACNLDCVYCFYRPRADRHMTWEDYRHVVEELARVPVFLVNISGGEAFLHPQIDRMLRVAHDCFPEVLTLTNGTVLKAAHEAVIRDILRERGSFNVQVSIDAVDPAVNGATRCRSDKALRTIARLADMGCHVMVALVVSRHNVDTVLASIDTLSRYTRYFHLMTVQPVPALKGADRDLPADPATLAALWRDVRALAAARDRVIETPDEDEDGDGKGREGLCPCATGAPCMAGFSHVVIDPNLEVRPCDRLVEVVVGDLRRFSLAQVWHGEALRPVLDSSVPFCRPLRDAALDVAVS